MPEILTIIIYVLLIILIIVAIAIGIKLYVTLSKVNALVDDVTQKVKSLDRVFEIVDVVNKRKGEPVVLNKEELCSFMDFVGNLDIRSLVAEKKISIKEKLEDLQI